MSKLGELRGSVTVEIEGVDGAGVATFSVPIAVLDQVSREGADVVAVSVGTPDGAIRDGVRVALDAALALVLANIPSAEVTPIVGALDVEPDLHETYLPHPGPSARTQAIWDDVERRLGPEGVGGSHP